MLLILYRAGADRDIGQYIVQIAVILRIQHLIRCRKAIITEYTHMELTYRNKPLIHIRFFLRIWLMQHPLVAASCGSRLICVYTGNDKESVLDLLIDPGQTLHVLADSVLPIRRAGPDNDKKFITLSLQYVRDLFILLCLLLYSRCCQRKFRLDQLRCREQALKCKCHDDPP